MIFKLCYEHEVLSEKEGQVVLGYTKIPQEKHSEIDLIPTP